MDAPPAMIKAEKDEETVEKTGGNVKKAAERVTGKVTEKAAVNERAKGKKLEWTMISINALQNYIYAEMQQIRLLERINEIEVAIKVGLITESQAERHADDLETTVQKTFSTAMEVVAKIKGEMFTEFSFTPALYKLLLYKRGSFLKPHRDSEKVDGMFATLVIQLPSLYKGRQLIVRHDGRTVTSDFSSTDEFFCCKKS